MINVPAKGTLTYRQGNSGAPPASLSSTPVLGHHGSGTSCSRPKQSYDELFAEVVRAWWEGNVEVSDSREGDDGFAYGVFEDGTTFTTEVPNVVWGLPKMTTGSRAPS